MSNCATAVPLNDPDSESSMSSNIKRSGSSNGTTYDNVVSKNLVNMGFTQKKLKNNKPNEHWKERVNEGGIEGNNASGDTEFSNFDSNDFSGKVDNKSDANHDVRFDFTPTDMTTAANTNVNEKFRKILDFPPSEYCALRSNDAVFLLDPSDPDKKLSWWKGLLPDEYFPPDLDVIKCDDFEDPRGYYTLLGCRKISSDA